MTILFLTRLFHPHVGGVEKHVERVSGELVTLGYRVVVITEQYEQSLGTRDTYKNIEIWRIPRELTKTKKNLWQWVWQHRELFKQADIIHAHDVFWWYLPLRFTLNKPIYTTFHGWEGTYPIPIKSIIWRQLAHRLSRGTIAVGDFITKWYHTRANVITYGATDQTNLPVGDKNRLLVLGRLSQDNDLSLVLTGLKTIKTQLPKLKITFLGDGELAWQAKDVGHVLGFHEDIQPYLKEVHWVIASSYLSILDALAAGRHVFSIYSNPLKADYLHYHPAANSFAIAGTAEELTQQFLNHYTDYQEHTATVPIAQPWIEQQTWDRLTQHYINLWRNNSYTFAYKDFQQELD